MKMVYFVWIYVVVLMLAKERRIDVDMVGQDGITPLMLAAREGRTTCLTALLQSGNPDLDKADTADRTPIVSSIPYHSSVDVLDCCMLIECHSVV